MSIVFSILLMIVILGIMVVAHEFGHFIVARLCKVQVNEFAIGMGPKIYKKQGKKTLFTIRALPIGGFCAMEGEDQDSENPHAFGNRPRWQRILVLLAGSFMNVLVGVLLLFVLACLKDGDNVPVIVDFYDGQFSQQDEQVAMAVLDDYGYTTLPTMTEVYATIADPATPADKKAALQSYVNYYIDQTKYEPFAYTDVLQVGDRFVKINGKHVYSYDYVGFFLSLAKDEVQDIVVERDGKEIEINDFTWKHQKVQGKDEYGKLYGFTMGYDTFDFGDRVAFAGNKSLEMVQLVTTSVAMLFNGSAKVTDLMGPVGMTDTINQVATSGSTAGGMLRTFLMFAAMIALNLAVVNQLPLPALDGGRILFILIEMIIRRKIPAKFEGMLHAIFFILLMLLMVVVFYGDIARILSR